MDDRRDRHRLHGGAGLLERHVAAEELTTADAQLRVEGGVRLRALLARGEREEREERADREADRAHHQNPTTARTVNESSASVAGAPVASRPSELLRRSY